MEDAQKFIGDYLARTEVAPENLFMSNKIVGESAALYSGYTGGYKAEFDARSKIITGETDASGTQNIYALYNNQDYLTPNGNFEVAIGSKAILHAGETIEMLPGTEIQSGAELAAFTTPMACPNSMYRASNTTNTNPRGYNNIWATTNVEEKKSEYELDTRNKQNGLHLFPNPNNGIFTVINYSTDLESIVTISDVSGKEIVKTTIANNNSNELNLQNMSIGISMLR